MATPVRLEFMEQTFVGEGCSDLPASVTEEEGQKVITTVWQLSEDEHATAAATGLVTLACVGIQPPVRISAPAIKQPDHCRFRIHIDNGEPLEVPRFVDALTIALHAMMQDPRTITFERLDEPS